MSAALGKNVSWPSFGRAHADIHRPIRNQGIASAAYALIFGIFFSSFYACAYARRGGFRTHSLSVWGRDRARVARIRTNTHSQTVALALDTRTRVNVTPIWLAEQGRAESTNHCKRTAACR
jgi:hypothetical protein